MHKVINKLVHMLHKVNYQSWGNYFTKVIALLHITSYFLNNVIHCSYILLKLKCNLIILHNMLLNERNLS